METSISYHFYVSQNSLPLFFFQPFKNEKENMFSSPAISKRAVGQHGPQAIVCKPLVYTQLLFLTLSHAVSIPRAVCSLDKPLHLQILYHPVFFLRGSSFSSLPSIPLAPQAFISSPLPGAPPSPSRSDLPMHTLSMSLISRS